MQGLHDFMKPAQNKMSTEGRGADKSANTGLIFFYSGVLGGGSPWRWVIAASPPHYSPGPLGLICARCEGQGPLVVASRAEVAVQCQYKASSLWWMLKFKLDTKSAILGRACCRAGRSSVVGLWRVELSSRVGSTSAETAVSGPGAVSAVSAVGRARSLT